MTTNQDARAAFEARYKSDANDPANAADLALFVAGFESAEQRAAGSGISDAQIDDAVTRLGFREEYRGVLLDFARALLAMAPATTPVDDKTHPRFMAGYDAGLKDGRYSATQDVDLTATTQAQEAAGKHVDLVEQIAQRWDECEWDDVGGRVDIGAAIRREFLPVAVNLDAPTQADSAPSAPAGSGQGGDERTLRDRAKARWMAEPDDTSLLEAYDRGWSDRAALAAPASQAAVSQQAGEDAESVELVEAMCARIKAADDAMADSDYMLDSDDCIAVLRGTWKQPLANEFPQKPAARAARQSKGGAES